MLAVLRGAVLVELPFAFEAVDRNAEGDDLPEESLDKVGWFVRPGRG